MNVLLDTHIAIWALLDSHMLTRKARDIILDPDNTVYYSTVSVWEILLKHSTHPDKINLTAEIFSSACKDAGYICLELCDKHIITAEKSLVQIEEHKDPFDRLLLAQAKTESLSLPTNDSKLPLYKEKCVISQ